MLSHFVNVMLACCACMWPIVASIGFGGYILSCFWVICDNVVPLTVFTSVDKVGYKRDLE